MSFCCQASPSAACRHTLQMHRSACDRTLSVHVPVACSRDGGIPGRGFRELRVVCGPSGGGRTRLECGLCGRLLVDKALRCSNVTDRLQAADMKSGRRQRPLEPHWCVSCLGIYGIPQSYSCIWCVCCVRCL